MESKGKMTTIQLVQNYIDEKYRGIPFENAIKPIVMTAQNNTVIFYYTVTQDMLSPARFLHHDIMAVIAAESIEATVQDQNQDNFFNAKNLVIRYENDTLIGKNIISRTYATKKNKQSITIHCEIWNNDQTKLIARAYSCLVKTQADKQVPGLLNALISR